MERWLFCRQRHWEELGKKSPFYRAQAGDWRVSDPAPVTVTTQPGDTRGVQKNTDIGWDIQVSGKVFNETRMHTAPANKAAQAYLPYINSIVENAVLLDSCSVDPSKPKSQNSLLMHSMYAVADIGKGPELLKLYVEEMNNPNTDGTVKRVYQLQNIEKQQLNAKGSGQGPSPVISTATIKSVADLFAAVKAKDAQFQPKLAGKTAKVVGWDGREVVTAATGPSITVDGKKYQLLGYDAKGSPVYEDARIVREQEASGGSGQGDSADAKKKTGSEVENISNNDTINSNRFQTTDDPMREVTGAGMDSDPKEIQFILNKLTEAGVEIRYHDSNMAYAPGLRAGVPGQFIIDKKASYSAWAHEYKHFCDDMADGFPGMRIFMDTEKCKQREIDAYNVEIELAKKANREDIVERLEKLKALEVSRFDRYPEAY